MTTDVHARAERVGRSRPPLVVIAVAMLGVVGWAWLLWVAALLASSSSAPHPGFDLGLLTQAGRDVSAGRSPYDAALVGGSAPVAVNLFYSYPPVIAQVMALVAAIPGSLVLVAWDALAILGLAAVTRSLAARLAPRHRSGSAVAIALALAPFCFPFAVGLLFGNLDVFFPAMYGAMVLGVLEEGAGDAPSDRRTELAAGVGLALAALAKLHPASMGAWFAVRAATGNRRARAVFLVALVAGIVAILASVVVGGIGVWTDYLAVVRAGSGASVVDPDNAGPAAQIALLLSRDDAFARSLQILVAASAIVITVVAARRGGDPLERLAWAAAASLAILPVTWFHYPSAFLPFAAAAVLRSDGTPVSRTVAGLVAAAAVVTAIAILDVGLIWLAIGLVLIAVRVSRPSTQGRTRIPAARASFALDRRA